MSFNHANNIDARSSIFNDSSNRTIINYPTYITFFGSIQASQPRLDNSSYNPLTPTDPETSSQKWLFTAPNRSSQTNLTIKTAMYVIIQIKNLSTDRRDSWNYHAASTLELERIDEVLDLTRRAIEEYTDRPLGQHLANMIAPEVEQCLAVLQALLAKIGVTRNGLFLTSINHLWHLVWRRQWDGDEMTVLKRGLYSSWNSLCRFLIALNSYVYSAFRSSQTLPKLSKL